MKLPMDAKPVEVHHIIATGSVAQTVLQVVPYIFIQIRALRYHLLVNLYRRLRLQEPRGCALCMVGSLAIIALAAHVLMGKNRIF